MTKLALALLRVKKYHGRAMAALEIANLVWPLDWVAAFMTSEDLGIFLSAIIFTVRLARFIRPLYRAYKKGRLSRAVKLFAALSKRMQKTR